MDESLNNPSLARLALLRDAQVIGQALLDRDMLQARFRTDQLEVAAQHLACHDVVSAAQALLVVLGPWGMPPRPGVGIAYAALSATIETLTRSG